MLILLCLFIILCGAATEKTLEVLRGDDLWIPNGKPDYETIKMYFNNTWMGELAEDGLRVSPDRPVNITPSGILVRNLTESGSYKSLILGDSIPGGSGGVALAVTVLEGNWTSSGETFLWTLNGTAVGNVSRPGRYILERKGQGYSIFSRVNVMDESHRSGAGRPLPSALLPVLILFFLNHHWRFLCLFLCLIPGGRALDVLEGDELWIPNGYGDGFDMLKMYFNDTRIGQLKKATGVQSGCEDPFFEGKVAINSSGILIRDLSRGGSYDAKLFGDTSSNDVSLALTVRPGGLIVTNKGTIDNPFVSSDESFVWTLNGTVAGNSSSVAISLGGSYVFQRKGKDYFIFSEITVRSRGWKFLPFLTTSFLPLILLIL